MIDHDPTYMNEAKTHNRHVPKRLSANEDNERHLMMTVAIHVKFKWIRDAKRYGNQNLILFLKMKYDYRNLVGPVTLLNKRSEKDPETKFW